MRLVKIPDKKTCINELDIALKYVNGQYKYQLTKAEITIINAIYQKYDDLLGCPDDDFISVLLGEDTNNALQEAYSEVQKKGRLKLLRSNLLTSIDKCPYCGISVCDELDHYLPTSIYKAISVYSRNLIPICHICNNLKRKAIQNGENQSFFHAYFETFPESSIFIANLDFSEKKLTVNFVVDKTNLNDDLGSKLDFQIERTELENRLQKETNSYLFDLKSTFEMMFESDGINGVKRFLQRQYVQNKEKYGVNFWKTSIVLALSDCESFCNGGFHDYFNGLKP